MEARRIAHEGSREGSRERLPGTRCGPRKTRAALRSIQLRFERGVFVLCAVVLVAAAVKWAFALKPGRAFSSAPIPTMLVTVQPGDTVWGIARRVSGDDADLRQVVHSISQLNQLENAQIRPGQALLVPARRQLEVGRSPSSPSVD